MLREKKEEEKEDFKEEGKKTDRSFEIAKVRR